MSLLYRFHPLAEQELSEAVENLEAERPGTGLALAAAVEQAILQVCEYPQGAPQVRPNIRAKSVLPTRRWHYAVIYRVQPGYIRILAVAHRRRQPFYWIGRR